MSPFKKYKYRLTLRVFVSCYSETITQIAIWPFQTRRRWAGLERWFKFSVELLQCFTTLQDPQDFTKISDENRRFHRRFISFARQLRCLLRAAECKMRRLKLCCGIRPQRKTWLVAVRTTSCLVLSYKLEKVRPTIIQWPSRSPASLISEAKSSWSWNQLWKSMIWKYGTNLAGRT